MKSTLLWIGVGSFVSGVILRWNAKSWGQVRINEGSGSTSIYSTYVGVIDQTGAALVVFGLLLCLLVFHHILSRDDS